MVLLESVSIGDAHVGHRVGGGDGDHVLNKPTRLKSTQRGVAALGWRRLGQSTGQKAHSIGPLRR